MQITRIDIASDDNQRFATLIRKPGADTIEVELLQPGETRIHIVQAGADYHDDQWSMAEILQWAIDGYRGTNGDIEEYFQAIHRIAQ